MPPYLIVLQASDAFIDFLKVNPTWTIQDASFSDDAPVSLTLHALQHGSFALRSALAPQFLKSYVENILAQVSTHVNGEKADFTIIKSCGAGSFGNVTKKK